MPPTTRPTIATTTELLPEERAAKSVRWLAVGLGATAVAGTALSLLPTPRWYIRVWDFPRVQLVGLAAAAAALYGASGQVRSRRDAAFLGSLGAAALFQARQIVDYTPLRAPQVERSERLDEGNRIRLVICNVLRENDRHGDLVDAIRAEDPDVVLLVEVDRRWQRALAPLKDEYPHVVARPQENHYGMMLLSRFPLKRTRVEYLVQDDIPSIHTSVVLPSGARVRLHCVHPRPPEPAHAQDSTPRDAELVLVGRRIGEEEDDVPAIVAGDLNDVAWSRTTRLFLRLSGMLDPRIGRGFYNSYNAQSFLMRWPLDHIFHSPHFRLVELKRLGRVGSDHFPMLVELSLETGAERAQDRPEPRGRHRRRADAHVRKQREEDRSGEDQQPG